MTELRELQAVLSAQKPITNYVLIKLAARCNLNCSYCYWFRDPSVYDLPPLLSTEVEDAFVAKLAQHMAATNLPYFGILLHGGEPLLLGEKAIARFGGRLRDIEREFGFKLRLAITTNGTLVTTSIARLLAELDIEVTVSVDGPRPLHDANRVDFKGQGTYDRVMAGIELLRANGVDPGVLAVANPTADPEEVVSFFVDTVGVRSFDLLVPDATHDDEPASIADFYRGLFDIWYDRAPDQRISIRFIESVAKGLVGVPSGSESIGYGPITTVTMLTDGSLEPLDVLRTARTNITKTSLNILRNSFDDVHADPMWQEIHAASLQLARQCQRCPYWFACGGGHIASRWSPSRRYDNPSVYCDDFKAIFGHAWSRIAKDLYLDDGESLIPLAEVHVQ